MKCLKCTHDWTPKVKRPRRCPNCKSANYEYPPGVGPATALRLNRWVESGLGVSGVVNPQEANELEK
jgi:hypothetical protein